MDTNYTESFPVSSIVSTHENFRPVLVRGYGNEPAQLGVIAAEGQHVVLTGTDPSKSIGYPRRLVYRYDASLFDRLMRAYESDDRALLISLWNEAEQY